MLLVCHTVEGTLKVIFHSEIKQDPIALYKLRYSLFRVPGAHLNTTPSKLLHHNHGNISKHTISGEESCLVSAKHLSGA